jgi:hypothetical protein
MKGKQVRIGAVYLAKVSGTLAPVRIVSESIYGGWDAVNVATKRDVRIRGAARLRAELEKNPATGKWRPVAVAQVSMEDWETRVRAVENEGLTRSDAQAVVDAEDSRQP